MLIPIDRKEPDVGPTGRKGNAMDKLYVNGPILTMEREKPEQALLVCGGRIEAVGKPGTGGGAVPSPHTDCGFGGTGAVARLY